MIRRKLPQREIPLQRSLVEALGTEKWDSYGIDMFVESAQRAQAESGAIAFVGDILDATFRPASFDVITRFHVFEHIYKPCVVLSKVFEWLKPGGIFYVLVPNINSAGESIHTVFRKKSN